MFALAAIGAAYKGYFTKGGEAKTGTDATTATIAAATLMDNLSIRQLSDALTSLSGDIVSLERVTQDSIHWTRSKYEQDREICQRLRENREAAELLAQRLNVIDKALQDRQRD